MLKYLFENKQIKNIIYTIDSGEMFNDNDKTIEQLSKEDSWKKTSRVNYLIYKENKMFNKSFFEKLKYYLNKHTIKCALIWSKKPKCVGEKKLPDFADWYVRYKDSFGGFKNWSDSAKEPVKKGFKDLKMYFNIINIPTTNSKNHLKRSIFYFADNNPQTNFYLIIPTYSRLLYKLPQMIGANKNKLSAEQYFHNWQYMIKWFIQESKKYPNIKIYGFDDLDYADNIANYEDLHHYNIDMNSMQLDAIANGTHILTPENINNYLSIMESKIKNYDLSPFTNELKSPQ